MAEALAEAERAYKKGEVPIGCVIVRDGKIIARARNKKERLSDSTAHAEMLALKKAQKKTGSKYLSDCTLFVTIEPCAMCAGALINTRIGRLVFGAWEPKTGCCGSVMNVAEMRLNHTFEVRGGVLYEECKEIMQRFFREKREKK
jgi:tRNA(adenine34) deaminase